MADRYWVGGTGTWGSSQTTNWSAATGLSFTASCTSTTLTTTGSPALVAGMTVWANNHTSLGTIVSGSVNTWVVTIGGTFTSQSMSAATVGASVPTAADNVFFDANSNSGTTAFGVTMANSPRLCNDLTISGLDGGMTLAGSAIGLTVSGSLDWPATNFTRSYTGTTTFNATTTGKTVTARVAFNGPVTFDGVGGGWTLGFAIDTTGGTLTITNGTFDTSSSGNYAVTPGQFSSSNSNIRTINLNASTLTSASSFPVTFQSNNLTFNAGTSTINCGSTSLTFAGGGQTFYNVSFTSGAITSASISGANTFNNLSITGRTTLSSTGTFSFSADQTISGTLALNVPTAAAYRTMLASSTLGTTRTLTCAAITGGTDYDFRDIVIAGAASPISPTRAGDCKGNSGITFPAAKTVFFSQTGSANWGATGSGSWSATSGGALDATQFPLAQDTAVFPAATYPASGSTTTINASYNIGTIDMSLRTSNTMTLSSSSNAPSIYGNWINGTGITLSGTGTVLFAGRTTQQITSEGKTFPQLTTINSPSGSVTLQDPLTINTTTLTNGTLDLNGFTLSTALFSSNNTNTRTIAFGTGNITITGTGTVWATQTITNLTITGTQVVNVTSTGSTAITVSTGGISEANSISFNFTGGTYALTFLAFSTYSARNVDFTGYAGTWNATSTGVIYGNLKLSSGMTLTSSASAMTFGATSGTQQITTNTKTLDFPVTFSGAGGTRQLQDAMTMGTGRTTTLTSGTLDLQSFKLSTGLFDSSNSNTRTIAFGTGSIDCTGTGVVWNTITATNLTTTGTQVVNVTSVGSTAISIYTGNGLSEANSISFNITGGTYSLDFGGNTTSRARNIDFTGYAGTCTLVSSSNSMTMYGNLTLSAGMSLTAGTSTILTFGATSGTKTITSNTKTMDFPITFNGVGGTWACQDALTLGSTRALTMTNGTLQLKDGVTSTVGSFATTGTTLKYLQSTTSGVQATLSDASGTNTVTYLSIQDSNATGGATFIANGPTNVDAGNNTGWIFTSSTGFLMFF